MVLRKHLLGTISQLLHGVSVVIHRLLKDHVALQHQQGALLILERWKKRRMRKKSGGKTARKYCKKKGQEATHQSTTKYSK